MDRYGRFQSVTRSNLVKLKTVAPAVVAICFMAVPMLMAFQNWDDPDRSNATQLSQWLSLFGVHSKTWSHDFY